MPTPLLGPHEERSRLCATHQHVVDSRPGRREPRKVRACIEVAGQDEGLVRGNALVQPLESPRELRLDHDQATGGGMKIRHHDAAHKPHRVANPRLAGPSTDPDRTDLLSRQRHRHEDRIPLAGHGRPEDPVMRVGDNLPDPRPQGRTLRNGNK